MKKNEGAVIEVGKEMRRMCVTEAKGTKEFHE